MSPGPKILIPVLVVASAAVGFLFYYSFHEAKSDGSGHTVAAASSNPAKTGGHAQPSGSKVMSKAFLRPRLDEAGKRNLAQDPAGTLTGHDQEGMWSRADDDLLVAWAAKDPQAAIKWVGAREHYVVQAQLLGAVATGMLLRDGPEGARRFLAEHKEDEQLRPKDQDSLETYLFYHLGREDTIDLAMQMLDAVKDGDGANAGALVSGIDGSRNEVAAMDYLAAKGHPVDVDYGSFQERFAQDPEFWSDWAFQRNSDLMEDIVPSWARDHPAEARTWLEKNLPEGDARRSRIDELLKTQAAPPDEKEKPEGDAGKEMENDEDK